MGLDALQITTPLLVQIIPRSVLKTTRKENVEEATVEWQFPQEIYYVSSAHLFIIKYASTSSQVYCSSVTEVRTEKPRLTAKIFMIYIFAAGNAPVIFLPFAEFVSYSVTSIWVCGHIVVLVG